MVTTRGDEKSKIDHIFFFFFNIPQSANTNDHEIPSYSGVRVWGINSWCHFFRYNSITTQPEQNYDQFFFKKMLVTLLFLVIHTVNEYIVTSLNGFYSIRNPIFISMFHYKLTTTY